MSQREDPRLHEFLKRYRPAPPSSQGNLEEYLFDSIEQDSQSRPKGLFWIFSGAVLTGVVLGWGIYRYSDQPQLTASAPEIENFVLENWKRQSADALYTTNGLPWADDYLAISGTQERDQSVIAR